MISATNTQNISLLISSVR